MDIEKLGSSPIGKLVPIHGRDARHGEFAYFAFLPQPLPSDIVLDSRTWTCACEASTALGKLDQACVHLPNPRLLIHPALWSEASILERWRVRRTLDVKRWTGMIGRLLEDLNEWPVTTIADTASRYNVSPMNATRMINHLVEAKILEEITGRTYARVFGATAVMEIVDRI